MYEEKKIVNSLQAVAEHFGKTERTIRRWRAQGMPEKPGGGYDLFEVETWHARRSGGDPGGGDGKDLAPGSAKAHDARYKKAKADLAEMEAARIRAELIPLKEIEGLFVMRIQAVKQGLLTLSRALPPLLSGQSERVMEAIIRDKVSELLQGFASPLPEAYHRELLTKATDFLTDLESADV